MTEPKDDWRVDVAVIVGAIVVLLWVFLMAQAGGQGG